MDQQEDTANSKKDDENNASLLRARAYPHEESGDAADFTKDCNIHAEDFKDQPISSCDTDSLTIPISTTSIETHPKISQNVKDKILKERVPIKDIQSVGSNSKESNTKDIENTEYKETVLDISDTDLELRWTDDDDDSHMHSEPRPLSDKALKELDEELGITGEVQNINQDSIDVSKKVEKQVETVEGKPAKVIDITVDNTENSSKVSLGDDMLKKVNRELEMADHKTNTENVENRNIDQRLDIASSEKPIGTSINDSFESEIDLDQTVEQLQQLIDLDDDVKQKSKIVNERKKSAEINLTTTDNSKLDIDSLGVTKSPKESINNRNDTNNQVQEFITVVETDKQPTLQLATINIGDKNVKIEPRNADLPPEMEDNSTIIENKSSDNVNVEPMDEDLLPKKEDTGENTKGNRLSSKIEPGIEFHDCINTSIPMQKSENLNKKTKVYNADSLNVNDSIDNASIFEENKDHDKIKGINDSVEDNIEVKNEMITPDLENSDSNRIHTEHGVNRPDVMLDIPSQEFDFDEFADASDMMDDTTELGKTNKDCNNLIEKTVTEIVNQLARDDEEVSENSEFSGIPDSYLDNISKSISDKKITTHGTNSNTTIDIGNQPSHTSVETTLTSIEKNVTDVSKPHVTSKIDNKIPIGSQSTQVTLEKKLKGSELSTDIAEVYQRANVLGKSLEKDTQSCDISKENVNDQGANYIDNKYLEPTELSAELEKQEQLIEKASETGVLANEICIEKMSKKEGTNPQPDTLETDKATENVKYQQDKATVLERNQKYPGPSNEYVKEQEDENSEVKTKDQETVESLTVTDKEQKSESTKEKDSQSEGILEKDPNITEQLTQKHTDEKMDVKPSKSNADANDIQPLTSNDDAKGETLDLPSTSNAVATHSLDVQPSTINADAKLSTDLQSPTSNDDAKGKTLDLPSTSNSTAAHSIDVQPSTINADAKGETLDIPSTSNDDVKRETLDMPSTSNTTATDSIDVQPLPINADAKLTTGLQPSNAEAKNKNDGQPDGKNLDSDNSEDVPEVAQDSLGLLAESSRVIDDDDEREAEEDEAEFGEGEDDDDDDFDPDDEESSNQHSEESNPAQSEIDIKDEGIDIVFGNEADTIGTADSNDANDGFMADEITIEDNEPAILDSIKTELIEEDIDLKPKEEADKTEKPTTEVRKSILSELLAKAKGADETKPSESKKSPAMSVFEASKNIVSIVDLGSSSEDDVQVHQKAKLAPPSGTDTKPDKVSVSASKSEPDKGTAECEKTAKESKKEDKEKSKHGEIFNLDSDEDDIKSTDSKDIEDTSQPRNNQCINHHCTSDYTVPYYLADRVTVAYYGAARRRKRPVCQSCLNIVIARNQGLLTGIKDMRPLMSLRMSRPAQQLLEISDSDSEGEDDPVGVGGAKILEEHLAELLNETWIKYKMDDRLKETEDYLQTELKKMEKQSIEIDNLLKDCQKETDKLRVEFYAGFEPNRKELPALSMQDTPIASYSCLESEEEKEALPQVNLRYPKRRSSSAIETTAKKQAIVSGCMDENDQNNVTRASLATKDEDKDISVVRLTAESAPADLPPPGELTRPPLRAGAPVFAMKNPYGAWLRGRLIEVLPKTPDQQFSQCRVRFEHKTKNLVGKVVAGRCIAYTEPCGVRMTIGTRVIALFNNSDNTMKRQSFFYSGIIAEIPNPVNTYRYLVFFDDGYVQYVQHCDVRLVYESSALVWEEVHPFSRDFVCNYLLKYPERPMVRMHTGQSLVVEYNGKWLETKVIAVDAAVVKVQFSDYRTEWIYRGSTRLQPLFVEFQAARRGDRARLPRSTKVNTRTNMPYVEYTRSDEQSKNNEQQQSQALEELRRQRAVAKKSTSAAMPQVMNPTTDVVSRVVHYTPKNSVRPYKMVPHTCGPQCKRNDLLSLKDLRTYNPLTKPLLSGWERQMIRHKYAREIMYRAPCGRRLRCMSELHLYLRTVGSEMPVDLFDFNPNTHCLAEFVLNKSNVQKKDLSNGKENVPVPCVNYYDNTLPEFCSYNTERTPTAGVPLNLDPDFLCGCDCDDDCADKTKCACWKMTLEGARTIGIEGPNIGYEYRRLPEPLPSGIYECNSRCKCKSTCLNRVVQNPLQLKLQVFKTLNRGWGIRALNDVPKGSFLCIYAGNLLTDATANLDGLNEGDEYLAELDYIEVVEAMKEGYEEDIPEADKELDKKETKKPESEPESEPSESEDEDKRDRNDQSDDDFRPTPYVGMALTDFSKRLRRRDKNKKNKDGDNNKEDKDQKAQEAKTDTKADDDEDCITISDDEEVRVSTREPARFTAQEGMTDSKVIPKYRSIRTYFGRDEACYIMDAKVQGNIGRYLNHSCSPNVFVQNVFVDTHDPRFPWVSFFALHYIRAGTELTWNYNYDIGSVPGKVLYCFCGAPNCRGRLL